MLVHTRNCHTLRKSRVDTDQIVDVEWAPDAQGVFEAGMRLLVSDQRGLLAQLATAIADAGANIEYVSMERPDESPVFNMFFSVQVRDRKHLANVMRALHTDPRSQARAARTDMTPASSVRQGAVSRDRRLPISGMSTRRPRYPRRSSHRRDRAP